MKILSHTGGMGNDTFIRYSTEVTDKEGQTYTFATGITISTSLVEISPASASQHAQMEQAAMQLKQPENGSR